VTVGLYLLVTHFVEWYPGFKALKKKPVLFAADLAPFIGAWAFGTLGILSVMGLIGWAFDTALWAANWLGDAALWLGVGTKPGQVSHGEYLPLTPTGSAMVVIFTGIFLTLRRKERYRAILTRGVWCGLCLGTSAGVAGLAAVPLAQATNELGAAVFGALG
jgi:hypothetical protein